MNQIRETNYFSRMNVYLKEMYPIHLRLINSVLLTTSFYILIASIHNINFEFFSAFTFIGTASVFTIMLILRLMDELKDREIDLQLFKDRPLPSGKVMERDIKFSLIIASLFFIGINTFFGTALFAALFTLGYAFLMFKYFFMPQYIRDNLLLNLATHNPVIPIINFYLFILFISIYDLQGPDIHWNETTALILMFWFLFFSWEITRKIKSPEEENEYVTYSQIFNPTGASMIGFGAQTSALLIGIYFFIEFNFSLFLILLLAAIYLLQLYGCIRFLVNPNPITSKLKPYTERYIFGFFLVIILYQVF